MKPQVKFTPPKIEKKEVVREEEKPPPKQKLDTVAAGQKTVVGSGKDLDAVDPPKDPGKGFVEPPKPPPPPKVFDFVEQMPEFPGGEEKLGEYLANNIVYPKQARQINSEGRVIVDFVVNEDGSVSDVKVKRDVAGGCGAEAVRVIKSMPKWRAGKQNGKAVKVNYTLPVMFSLGG